MKNSLLYKKLGGQKIQCLACQRKCLIDKDKVGFCLARKNTGAKLHSLLWGQITGIQVDPIEKKPFYHFKPGSLVATIGSWGCNFRCKQCLNYSTTWGATNVLQALAKNPDQGTQINNKDITPNEIAKQIIQAGYQGIAFSYNEPVIWTEFAAEIAREFKSLAASRQHPVSPFAVFVTNGSWTRQTIDLLSPLIEAANIDLKGFSEKTYRKMGAFFGEIPEMAKYAQKKGIFIELTTLFIPGINDDPGEIEDLVNWIVRDLGPDTPWHLSQYDPQLAPDPEFQKIPFTSPQELQRTAGIGEKAGLHHIYIWPACNALPSNAGRPACNALPSNAGRAPSSHHSWSDTICPHCRRTVIKRSGGWQPEEIHIKENNTCKFCDGKLNVIL